MQYGDKELNNDSLAIYIGALAPSLSLNENAHSFEQSTTQTKLISQRDTRLLHLRLEVILGWIFMFL